MSNLVLGISFTLRNLSGTYVVRRVASVIKAVGLVLYIEAFKQRL